MEKYVNNTYCKQRKVDKPVISILWNDTGTELGGQWIMIVFVTNYTFLFILPFSVLFYQTFSDNRTQPYAESRDTI